MPELPPSVLKKGDGRHLVGPKPKSEKAKADRYRSMRPGVQVSDAQAAHRYELMDYRNENGIVRPRRKARVGSITVPPSASALWDENGKMRP